MLLKGLDHKAILDKADTYMADITAGGGELLQAPAQKFLAEVLDKTNILKKINVIPLSAPSEAHPVTGFGSFISRGDTEYQESTPATRNALNVRKVQFNTKDFKATVFLSYKILDENIEKGNFLNTVIGLIKNQLAVDMENVVLNGDVATPIAHPLYPLLSVMDGMRKKILSHILITPNFGRAEHIQLLKIMESRYIGIYLSIIMLMISDGT